MERRKRREREREEEGRKKVVIGYCDGDFHLL